MFHFYFLVFLQFTSPHLGVTNDCCFNRGSLHVLLACPGMAGCNMCRWPLCCHEIRIEFNSAHVLWTYWAALCIMKLIIFDCDSQWLVCVMYFIRLYHGSCVCTFGKFPFQWVRGITFELLAGTLRGKYYFFSRLWWIHFLQSDYYFHSFASYAFFWAK